MSDDIIEQMARAAHATCRMWGKSWEDSSIGLKEVYIMEMRAAYAIARRAVLEEAAKVAEAEKMQGVIPLTLGSEQTAVIEAIAKITGEKIAIKLRRLAGEA